jgi:DNA replication and repair protein RecF
MSGEGGSGARATLTAISLRDFRNFARLDLALPDAGIALVGDNGQGKTNLLEAIYYLSLFRSVRGARDVDLLRFGQEAFYIEGEARTPEARTIGVGFERTGRRKRVRVNDGLAHRLSDALGVLPVVMFSPADVELLIGGPGGRRRFLDIMLAVGERGYLEALQQYRAALLRRNAALRAATRRGSSASDSSAIAVWDEPLAVHGARLVRARRAWVGRARAPYAQHMSDIGEAGTSEVRYRCTIDAGDDVEAALLAALGDGRATDLRFAMTRSGPHRDDLLMLLDGHDLRTFGSAGQQRSAAIALRSIEADTLRVARGVSPVFLLDDPFAELDADRASRVLGLLQRAGASQTILAVPRDTDIPGALTTLPRRRIARGEIG